MNYRSSIKNGRCCTLTERWCREEPRSWQDVGAGDQRYQDSYARIAEEHQERRGIRCQESAVELKKRELLSTIHHLSLLPGRRPPDPYLRLCQFIIR